MGQELSFYLGQKMRQSYALFVLRTVRMYTADVFLPGDKKVFFTVHEATLILRAM